MEVPMNAFSQRTALLLTFSATLLAPVVAASSSPQSEPQLVRLSYVQGDVRFNRGDARHPDLKKPWEQAEVNLAIEENFAVVTGDGRAEIEFESGSTLYLAEDSTLLFEQLLSSDGLPTTRLELVSGSVTTAIQTLPKEHFVIDTPTGQLRVSYPQNSFVRLDSYLDGSAFTPQGETGWDYFQNGSSKIHLVKGQTLTYDAGLPLRIDDAGQSKPATDYDGWVSARVAARASVMSAALKASGLSSPISGLIDMYASGIFSPCPPYGMCWEPSQQSLPLQQSSERTTEPATTIATDPTASDRTRVQAAAQSSKQNAGIPFTPVRVSFRTLVSECPFPSWSTTEVLANNSDELAEISKRAYLWNLDQPWGWPVCHYGRWIYRDHRYRVIVKHKRCHHPARWVKVGNKTGFVPAHPADEKGKPPINLKHGIFMVSSQSTGGRIQRVEFNLKEVAIPIDPPKEFRTASHREFDKVQPPDIQAHLLQATMHDAKSPNTRPNEAEISYDYAKGKFLQSSADFARRSGSAKPVVVAGLNSRGGFSGNSRASSSGEFGNSGDRAHSIGSSSGGGSSAGHSNGASGASGSRGGGNSTNGSSAGRGGGGGGGSGGGSRGGSGGGGNGGGSGNGGSSGAAGGSRPK
jgi:FecR-like protein